MFFGPPVRLMQIFEARSIHPPGIQRDSKIRTFQPANRQLENNAKAPFFSIGRSVFLRKRNTLPNRASVEGEPCKCRSRAVQAIRTSRASIQGPESVYFLHTTLVFAHVYAGFQPQRLLFRKICTKAVSANKANTGHFESQTTKDVTRRFPHQPIVKSQRSGVLRSSSKAKPSHSKARSPSGESMRFFSR